LAWAALAKYQREGEANKRNLFLTVMEAGKTKTKLLVYLALYKILLGL
jgi:hypothetical protein